jgi:hypothetical protein
MSEFVTCRIFFSFVYANSPIRPGDKQHYTVRPAMCGPADECWWPQAHGKIDMTSQTMLQCQKEFWRPTQVEDKHDQNNVAK